MTNRWWWVATLIAAGCGLDGGDDDTNPNKHVFLAQGVAPPERADHAGDGLGTTVQELAPSDTNGINRHTGGVMSAVNVYYIWYGTWPASSTARPILNDVANLIGNTWYWNINTTYFGPSASHVTSTVHFAGSINDAYSHGATLSDAGVAAVVADAVTSHRLPSDPNAVYFVLGSADVNETSGMCSIYCGWHDMQTVAGAQLKYAFVGDASRCPSACMAQPNGPNNNPGADGMASVIAHELQEAATDPNLDAWFDGSGQENADKCAWNFGPQYTAANGTRANMRLGARDFLIQENWVNARGGSCALGIHYDTLEGFLTSAPATSSFGAGELDVFARGGDNALWHRYYSGGGWSAWEWLGGTLTSAPAAVSSGPGRIDVFARGLDNSLVHLAYDHGWGSWESLGGILTSAPAVASWGAGRLDVFVRATDNSLAHLPFAGSWGSWENLGGILTSEPTAVSWGTGRIDVFLRAADSTLFHRWYEGGWSGWEPLGGGPIASGAGVASWAPGHLDVFARSVDNTILHRGFPASIFGGWTGFESLGVTALSTPAAVSWAAGRIDAFVLGEHNAIWHTAYDGAW